MGNGNRESATKLEVLKMLPLIVKWIVKEELYFLMSYIFEMESVTC